ncbi:hypothetical protein SETIT_5G057200v2 [Setaria italica]|uniref:Uncharacterized protein n=1 Tax=Setaria italica TaxID=4555 RepID=A0A368R1M8_SETIT|nr:hypothetical protein SETIT_5G057200v2 [Setaria italica]
MRCPIWHYPIIKKEKEYYKHDPKRTKPSVHVTPSTGQRHVLYFTYPQIPTARGDDPAARRVAVGSPAQPHQVARSSDQSTPVKVTQKQKHPTPDTTCPADAPRLARTPSGASAVGRPHQSAPRPRRTERSLPPRQGTNGPAPPRALAFSAAVRG